MRTLLVILLTTIIFVGCDSGSITTTPSRGSVPTEYRVNLDSPARPPFPGAMLKFHQGKGTAMLERRGADLFLNGERLTLYRTARYTNGGTKTNIRHFLIEVRQGGKRVSAKVLECLTEHPELWPNDWKKDWSGDTALISFTGDIFGEELGGEIVYSVNTGFWDEAQRRVISTPDFYYLTPQTLYDNKKGGMAVVLNELGSLTEVQSQLIDSSAVFDSSLD